jgi:hypothetical protein
MVTTPTSASLARSCWLRRQDPLGQVFSIRGKRRCRKGGATGLGAPRKNKNALKHGVFTKEAVEEWKQFQALIGQTRKMLQYFK